MALNYEAFDLSGRVSIEIGDADQVLLKISRQAKTADGELSRLQKNAASAADSLDKLGNQKAAEGAGQIAKNIQAVREGLNNISADKATKEIERIREQVRRLNEEVLKTLSPPKQPAPTIVKPTSKPADLMKSFADAEAKTRQRAQSATERLIIQSEQAIARAKKIQSRIATDAIISDLKSIEKERKQLESAGSGDNQSILKSLGIAGVNPIIAGTAAAVAALALSVHQSTTALQTASGFETAERGLSLYYETAAALAGKLGELEQVAQRTQGLKFLQAVEAQRNLQAANISASDATRSIEAFGNALAIVGGGEAEMNGVIVALTQIASKSKISAEEINQLAERIPQIRAVMQNIYGTSDTEELQKRGLDPRQFLRDVTEELEKLPKAQSTAAGAWESFSDATAKAYAEMGKPALPAATELLEKLTLMVEKNSDVWADWGESLAETLTTIGKLADGIDYLMDSGVANMLKDLPEIIKLTNEWTNPLIAVIDAYLRLKDAIDQVRGTPATLGVQGSADATAGLEKQIQLMRQAELNGLQVFRKHAKEEYDFRLADLDNFYKEQKLVADSGARGTRELELKYQKNLLNLENRTYKDRAAALRTFYEKQIQLAATGAERVRLAQEQKIQEKKLELDFGASRAQIAGQVAALQKDIREKLRTDLSTEQQIEFDKVTQKLGENLEQLAESFQKGGVTGETYWQSANKALTDYINQVYKAKDRIAGLALAKDGLTDLEKKNEREKALLEWETFQKQIDKQRREILNSIVSSQVANDKAITQTLQNFQQQTDAATLELIEFYRIIQQNPGLGEFRAGLSIEEFFDKNFLKGVKGTYAELIKDGKDFEEEFFTLRQQYAEQALLDRIDSLQKERDLYAKTATEQNQYNRQIADIEGQLLSLRASNFAAFINFKNQKLEENLQKEKEVSRLALDASQSAAAAQFNLEKSILESQLDSPASRGQRVSVIDELARIERQRALDEKQAAQERLRTEQAESLKRIEGAKNEAKLKSDINEAYRLKELGLEKEYQQKLAEIARQRGGQRTDAAAKDAFDKAPAGARGFFEGIGIEKFQSDAEMMEATMQRLGNVGANAFNSLADAMGSVIENWVLTGEMSGENAKKAVAAALAMASAQSAVSAIMETAYGIAALTPWGAAIYGPAPFHFKAAALFAAVAAGTGLAGRAVAGDSFKKGSAGGSSYGGAGGTGQRNQDSPDYFTSQQQAQSAMQSGTDSQSNAALLEEIRQLKQSIVVLAGAGAAQAETVGQFVGLVTTKSESQVFISGANQNPGEFGKRTHEDMKRNPTLKSQFGKDLGMR